MGGRIDTCPQLQRARFHFFLSHKVSDLFFFKCFLFCFERNPFLYSRAVSRSYRWGSYTCVSVMTLRMSGKLPTLVPRSVKVKRF